MTIIGGAAIDVLSRSDALELGSKNSQIGKIFVNEGGSTRNSAECLGRLGLGADTTFICGVGDDDKKTLLTESLIRVGVSAEGFCVKPG